MFTVWVVEKRAGLFSGRQHRALSCDVTELAGALTPSGSLKGHCQLMTGEKPMLIFFNQSVTPEWVFKDGIN